MYILVRQFSMSQSVPVVNWEIDARVVAALEVYRFFNVRKAEALERTGLRLEFPDVVHVDA